MTWAALRSPRTPPPALRPSAASPTRSTSHVHATPTTTRRRGPVVIRNVHQSGSGDHDRLGFHPDCPICGQDRLFGVLSPEPVWARRLRVLLAAGVLAVSAGATTTSVASEPDDQQEGVVVPAPGAPSQPVGDGPSQ